MINNETALVIDFDLDPAFKTIERFRTTVTVIAGRFSDKRRKLGRVADAVAKSAVIARYKGVAFRADSLITEDREELVIRGEQNGKAPAQDDFGFYGEYMLPRILSAKAPDGAELPGRRIASASAARYKTLDPDRFLKMAFGDQARPQGSLELYVRGASLEFVKVPIDLVAVPRDRSKSGLPQSWMAIKFNYQSKGPAKLVGGKTALQIVNEEIARNKVAQTCRVVDSFEVGAGEWTYIDFLVSPSLPPDPRACDEAIAAAAARLNPQGNRTSGGTVFQDASGKTLERYAIPFQ
jgi:hypothetical protein